MMKKKDTFNLSNKLAARRHSQSASILEIRNIGRLGKEPAGFSSLRVPGSKSISNRAILLASLARGSSHLHGVLFSEDTGWMIQICRQLGAQISELEDKSLLIEGCAGRFKECTSELYVGNAGTCARFLCAALVRGTGTYVIRGNSRMHERPMAGLIGVLRQWGAKIQCLEKEGFLPVKIESVEKLPGGPAQIRGNISSQFLSALLMLAPYTEEGVEISVQGDFVSSSYVTMTYSMLKTFGIEITNPSPRTFSVPGQQEYLSSPFKVPADASSASYFFALAAITGREVRIEGLEEEPVQSDLHFVHLLREMGCYVEFQGSTVIVRGSRKGLSGIKVEMEDMTDVVPTLAIVAMFAKGATEISRVAHMRAKECDRIRALCVELRKLGADVVEYSDGLRIEPPVQFANKDVLIRTYDDHRIAMAFAILAKRVPGVQLEDPECVSKTYPGFFEDLNAILND